MQISNIDSYDEVQEDIKDKWIKALRSGTYYQTQGALEYNGANCCLGVLAEESFQECIKEKEGSSEMLGVSLKDLSGSKIETVEVKASSWVSVIDLNDQYELSFEQIALCLENLPARWV